MNMFKTLENPKFQFSDIPRDKEKKLAIILCHVKDGIEFYYTALVTSVLEEKECVEATVFEFRSKEKYLYDPNDIILRDWGNIKANQIVDMGIKKE